MGCCLTCFDSCLKKNDNKKRNESTHCSSSESICQVGNSTLNNDSCTLATKDLETEDVSNQLGMLVRGVTMLNARRPRSGMWFLIHKSEINNIESEEVFDVYSDFFKDHPNNTGSLSDFFAIRLSIEQAKKQHHRIRMSSYPWQDVKGIREDDQAYKIPRNYDWFVEFIRKGRFIGWVDFVANVATAVPTQEVINYMGGLYAEFISVGQWLCQHKLLKRSMTRGWIYQESAFGELCADTMRQMLVRIRGLTGVGQPERGEMLPFLEACMNIGLLFARRGYERRWTEVREEGELKTWAEYGDTNFLRNICRTLSKRCGWDLNDLYVYLQRNAENIAHQHLLDVMTKDDAGFQKGMGAFLKLVCPKAYAHCKKPDDFFETFGSGMVRAYLMGSVTYEKDRENAITSVAAHIVQNTLNGPKMTSREIMFAAWEGLRVSMQKLNGGSGITYKWTDIKTNTPGWIFAGLGQVVGSRVVWDQKMEALRYKGENDEFETLPNEWMYMLDVRYPEKAWDVEGDLISSEEKGDVDLFVSELHQHKVALFVCAPREKENWTDVDMVVSAKTTNLKIPDTIFFYVGAPQPLKQPSRDSVLFD